MAYRGLLTLDSKTTESIYLRKKSKAEYSWDGEEVGPIDHITNRVSTTIPIKLYYCASGYYFILEKYDKFHHCVEILKEIFDIPRKRYNICTYGKAKYFMFTCDPDYERPINISKVKRASDDFRVIALFHWIIGVSGKFWLYQNGDEKVIFSKGPYHFDFSKVDMSRNMASRVFTDKETKDRLAKLFIDEKKLDLLNEFISQDIRWWYLEIIRKLDILT